MFLNMKKRIFGLLDTVSEMLGVMSQLSDPVSAVSDCLAAVEAIHFQFNQEKVIPDNSLEKLLSVKQSFYDLLNNPKLINEKSVKLLNEQVLLLKSIIKEEIRAKLNVVFFPYKASMWDSLATVYEAARKDKDCVVHVVPIPYYQLSQKEAIPTYEGDRFPENVPITHFSQYNLGEQQPDIVFVHNIYDQYNTLTRVNEDYFTSNLKKFTDMLVYVPYHISSFLSPAKGDRRAAYSLPAINNVDKIILIGDFLKNAAIQDGIPEEKLLALGSPKLDSIVNAINDDIPFPVKWKDKVAGKTVYLVNTGCLFFVNEPFLALEWLLDTFNIPRFIEDSVVIWRPHPLTTISIMKYIPGFMDYYLSLTEKLIKAEDTQYKNVILDETDDYIPALKAADVLISNDGSLLRSYLLTEKKVLYWGKELPSNSRIPSNSFYYTHNQSEPWYELVKKFATGYDPLAENRKGIAAKVYANSDGTSGEKVYQTVKECVLKNS